MRVRFAVVPAAALLLGCSRGDSSSDWSGRAEAPGVAQAQPAPACSASAPVPVQPAPPREGVVRNGPDVKRFTDESPLGYLAGTLVKSVIAHTAPDDGEEVTLLVGGTAVNQIAEHDGTVLVSFPAPANPQDREIGWIPLSAMQPTTRASCPGTQVPFRTAQGTFCAKPCRDSQGCGPDALCVQSGTPVERGGRITNLATYCVAK
jgi:hypothetical protein